MALSEEFEGRVIITWPKPGPGIRGELVQMVDADTGQQLTSVLEMKVHAAAGSWATAELLMLVNEHGKPLPAGAAPLLAEGGETARSSTFRWFIAEARTAE